MKRANRLQIPAVLAVAALSGYSVVACEQSSTPDAGDTGAGDAGGDVQPEPGLCLRRTETLPDGGTRTYYAFPDGRTSPVPCMTVCPGIRECYSQIQPVDGGVETVYVREDGGISSTPCPMVPSGCPVA